MEFSEEPISPRLSLTSIQRHGHTSPFRHHTVIQEYIEGLVDRNGYPDLVEFNTTVELIRKTSHSRWELTLRRETCPALSKPETQSPALQAKDYWYTESFDAVVIASGHYTVPYVPHVDGLAEFMKAWPGSIEHSKSFRGVEKYRGKVDRIRPFQSSHAALLGSQSVC